MGDLPTIRLRCPSCGHRGSFEAVAPNVGDALVHDVGDNYRTGQRACPNADCRAIVFVVVGSDMTVSYPPEVLDFDPTDLPDLVRASLEEAVKCHASACYKAAGMMVRKAIEAMCDERQAQGGNLKDRIKDLRTKVILPDELFDAIDELRLLGNDAAHVSAREYDDVGKDEVEVGIDLAKEILKAVYQYRALLARMRTLKTTP
jgi:hypothetical protein